MAHNIRAASRPASIPTGHAPPTPPQSPQSAPSQPPNPPNPPSKMPTETLNTSTNLSTQAHITSLFSSLQDPISSSILPISTRRLRAKMRGYSPHCADPSSSSAVSSPTGSTSSTGSAATAASSASAASHSSHSFSSSAGTVRVPIYTNWVFVTSAEVLARAGEGEEEAEPPNEAAGGGTAGKSGGGWTKRQYRIESEKLRGKEWVFQ
ncbi:hypothetical protein BZA05DRAFT_20106 [Tricharina praecox]|uniref:uncharacterized protein n=1 Tax=Tricharina praecox TaxID=43433 RepID=UPI00221F0922|nr:uncharacterized protein BZA05DRAFT_20106 [Tricharina praecox]KAI5859030.1 hypothetical protein BZA05DRAFT_20106 [Tricharina praecox]